jgi:hypothetical protein
MPFRAHTPNLFSDASSIPRADVRASDSDLTAERSYRVRVMGEEELELLRAAASQDGLQLASLNWILASLANHGFLTIIGNGRRLELSQRRRVI